MARRSCPGALLETDDPLDGSHMPEAPLPECVFEIDQFLGQFVQIESLARRLVYREPGALDRFVVLVRPAHVARHGGLSHKRIDQMRWVALYWPAGYLAGDA